MQHRRVRLVSSLAFGAALLVTSAASAQSDLQYAVPDMLLLVDTSGSMAYTAVRDPAYPQRYAEPACAAWPNATTVDINATSFNGTTTPPDRWAMLVSVLTGTVQGMKCSAQSRASVDFKQEFSLGGTSYGNGFAPYDVNYLLPYNRIVATSGANSCTPAPSWDATIRTALETNALDWPTTTSASPIYWRTVGSASSASVCPFQPQDTDGLIDQFSEMARFGLMTFDPTPSWLANGTPTIGTGIMTGGLQAFYQSGIGDTWSYFPGWMTDSSAAGAATGWPGGCDANSGGARLMEVGARNPAAPPWEGRLIGFGDNLADTATIVSNNGRTQQALLAMRPYSGTPIAGMLEDARYFLLTDATSKKPYFVGGATDPAFSTTPGMGCRKRYVVLITDGGPNLDLRPDCAYTVNNIPGHCPYAHTPAETVKILADNNIQTFVVGIAVTATHGSTTKTCTDVLSNGINPCGALASCTTTACPTTSTCAYGYCIPQNDSDKELLATCCTIKGIASQGSTKDPFFVQTPGELYNAFSSILSAAIPGTRTRTQPVFAAGNASFTTSGTSTIAAARFLSSFTTSPGDLFIGRLERERFQCKKAAQGGALSPELQAFDATKGDSLADALNATVTTRKIFTVVGALDGTQIRSTRSIRPFYNETNGDYLGKYGISDGDATTKMVTAAANTFAAAVDARALLGDTTCPTNTACCWPSALGLTPSSTDCRNRFLNLELGLAAGDANIKYKRASAFGAIMHATPVLSVAPSSFLRDDSYLAFQNALKARKPLLFASTTDGQLHAFETGKLNNTELNELWSFIPPAVLPSIGKQFPDRYHASPQVLLDGPVVTRDVAGVSTVPQNGRFLTRTKSQAQTMGSGTRWYTALVGAFGSQRGFYALDVSWPDTVIDPPAGYAKGPRFLWQLTTDADGLPLFGDKSATPAIATLYFQMPGESEASEHAVAILPGGRGGTPSPSVSAAVQFDTSPSTANYDARFPARSTARAYTTDGSDAGMRALGGARSITIVRLDTGEIIRTFRHGAPSVAPILTDKEAPVALYTAGRITNAGFDAPIIGQVVTYPSGPGAVSDRAYFGDAEGKLWRLNLSSKDSALWGAYMMLDAYPNTSTYSMTYTWASGAPIEAPPIVSTDTLGRVTVAVSTGDQVTITASGDHPVWSFTEKLTGSRPVASVNWYLNPVNAKNVSTDAPHLANGERVTGPMSLFDGKLYFTTYDPGQENPATCAAGQSYLWAVHYINAGTDASLPPTPSAPQNGPIPMLDPNPPSDNPISPTLPTSAALYVRQMSLGLGTVAFGVGVSQKPSCYTVEPVSTDPFLGFGSHSAITGAAPGQFQLLVQTSGAGTSQAGGQTQTTVRNLATPAAGAQIDSWASLID